MSYRILVLGAGTVGKTSFIRAFASDEGLLSYWKEFDVDKRRFVLEIYDSTEQMAEEFSLKYTEAVIVLFDLSTHSSLSKAREILRKVCNDDKKVPMVLVGNKCDLGNTMSIRALAVKIAEDWGNIPYFDTSAHNGSNIERVFADVCRQIMRTEVGMDEGEIENKNKTQSNPCIIL